MDYDEIDGPAGVPIRTPKDQGHKTCPECGGDCYPGADDLGVLIAFVWCEHGVHSVVDPFGEKRKR